MLHEVIFEHHFHHPHSEPPTEHHAEAGLHGDDKVVEAEEVHVEQHEEHCDEGKEAEQEGDQETTQVIPALAQCGRQQPCRHTIHLFLIKVSDLLGRSVKL